MRTESGCEGDPTPSLRVLLAGGYDLGRRSFRARLEGAVAVDVFEVGAAQEAMAAALHPVVRLIFLDVDLVKGEVGPLLERIRAEVGGVPILILAGSSDEQLVHTVARAGAKGYVLRDAGPEELRSAVDSALRDEGFYLHPRVAREVFRLRQAGPAEELELSSRVDDAEPPRRRRSSLPR